MARRAYYHEGLLTIEEDVGKRKPKTRLDVYKARQVTSQIGGLGVELLRLTLRRGETRGPEPYHVLLGGPHGDACDCPGFVRWGRCKHLISLREAGTP